MNEEKIMSKRKSLSADEKRVRLLDLFYEKKDFFQLKEIEKIAFKEKGIISQSVKDVLQSLVDDDLVDSDKIGNSIYYWAFPSKTLDIKKKKLAKIESEFNEMSFKLNYVKEALKMAKEDKEYNSERENILQKITELNLLKNNLEIKLEIHSHSDPKNLETLKNNIEKAKDAANYWTDNVFMVKSWCKNKFMIDGEILDKHFGIPANFEYLD